MPPFSKDTEEASTTAPRQPHGRRGPSTQVPEPLRAAPAQSPQAAWGQAGCSLQTTLLRGKTPAVVRSGPPHRDAAPDPKSSFSPPYKRVRGEGRGGGGVGTNPGQCWQRRSWRKKKKPDYKFCRASLRRDRWLFPASFTGSSAVPAAAGGWGGVALLGAAEPLPPGRARSHRPLPLPDLATLTTRVGTGTGLRLGPLPVLRRRSGR